MLKLFKDDRKVAGIIALAGLLGLLLANTIADFSHQIEGLHYISELALALFFFMIGLELKTEMTHGVFAKKSALLIPGLAAVLGALVPAGLYFLVTRDDPIASSGWAIPMATDATFAIAVFALFGSRMPNGSRQFLLALAIVDDLFAIAVIALFLRTDVITALLVTGSALLGMLVPTRFTDRVMKPLIPINNAIVLPLYAFCALAIQLDTDVVAVVGSTVGIAVLLRVVGKTAGISLGAYLGSKFVKDALPFSNYFRISVLGGIGFTVAFFVNDLVFAQQKEFHKQAIVASLVAGLVSAGLAAITLRAGKK